MWGAQALLCCLWWRFHILPCSLPRLQWDVYCWAGPVSHLIEILLLC